MSRRHGKWERRCDCAPEAGPAAAAPGRATQPWWQGGWQALGGLFNLLAALAGRWPRHGG